MSRYSFERAKPRWVVEEDRKMSEAGMTLFGVAVLLTWALLLVLPVAVK